VTGWRADIHPTRVLAGSSSEVSCSYHDGPLVRRPLTRNSAAAGSSSSRSATAARAFGSRPSSPAPGAGP